MKIAIPYQNGQVFPHFGHAPQFKFYTIESGMILHTEVVETAGSGHSAVTAFLMRGGVDTLICGSIGAGAQTAVARGQHQAVRRCQRRRRQGCAGAAGRKARP